MTAKRFGKVQQVVLLFALALGVVAMHHVSPASGMPGAAGVTVQAMSDTIVIGAGDHGPGMPGGMPDVRHLCLAVLLAAGVLLLALVAASGFFRFATTVLRAPGLRGPPRRGRPPDGGGRGILTSLCVLRT